MHEQSKQAAYRHADLVGDLFADLLLGGRAHVLLIRGAGLVGNLRADRIRTLLHLARMSKAVGCDIHNRLTIFTVAITRWKLAVAQLRPTKSLPSQVQTGD